MLRIVIPQIVRLTQSLSNNPDARDCLAFLTLACLQERALDAARIKKASLLALRGFVARPGFEPGTSGL